MARIIPEIIVSDIEKSRDFYSTLGFVKDNEGTTDEKGCQWYSLALEETNLWLLREDTVEGFDGSKNRGHGVHLYLSIPDVDGLYDVLQKAGLKGSILTEIETQWYGLREFKVKDPDGYIWTLNSPVTEQAKDSMDGEDE